MFSRCDYKYGDVFAIIMLMAKGTFVRFPKWVIRLYAVLVIILIPWSIYLALKLPTRHTVHHWDAVWVGFDAGMILVSAITVWFVLRKSIWVIVTATMLATLFVVDAWFDIMTAKPGKDQDEAIFFGIMEIMLALITYRFVHLLITNSAMEHTFTFITHGKKNKK